MILQHNQLMIFITNTTPAHQYVQHQLTWDVIPFSQTGLTAHSFAETAGIFRRLQFSIEQEALPQRKLVLRFVLGPVLTQWCVCDGNLVQMSINQLSHG